MAGAHPYIKVELPRHLTRAEADTLLTSCISEGVSASVSAEYNTPKFVDNPKYVLAPTTKSHNLAVRQSCMYARSVIIVSKGIHDGPCLCNIPVFEFISIVIKSLHKGCNIHEDSH